MVLSISQYITVSYNAVLANMKRPENQWAESALLNKLESMGGIERKSLGPAIEVPLDYQRNPGATFLATDLQATSLSATEFITAASFTPGQLSVPMTWTKMQEVQNSSENQKVDFSKSIMENGITSHDDLLEEAFFATSTDGFLGFLTHITDAGTGSDGGIDSGTYSFWRNQQATYTDDTDIEAAFTTVMSACTKGSGSKKGPRLMVSGSATYSLFSGSLQPQQRFETQDAKAGFKSLKFENADYIYSKNGGTRVYFLSPGKSFSLVVSKQYFRERGDTQELQNANGFTTKLYSACQTVTGNRSRLGVAHL